jgi:hypothetical protein
MTLRAGHGRAPAMPNIINPVLCNCEIEKNRACARRNANFA